MTKFKNDDKEGWGQNISLMTKVLSSVTLFWGTFGAAFCASPAVDRTKSHKSACSLVIVLAFGACAAFLTIAFAA